MDRSGREICEEVGRYPIVHEYPEVFPEDLATIEFRIDLVLGTALIYKRPYKMAAEEMVEVKKQVDEQL
jgi:hypothetical protein